MIKSFLCSISLLFLIGCDVDFEPPEVNTNVHQIDVRFNSGQRDTLIVDKNPSQLRLLSNGAIVSSQTSGTFVHATNVNYFTIIKND